MSRCRDVHNRQLLIMQLQRAVEGQPLVIMNRLFDLLATSSSDAVLQLYCMNSLNLLLPVLVSAPLRRQAIDLILSAMTRHAVSFEVHMESCKLLSTLIKTQEDLIQPKICLSTLLSSVERHILDPTLVLICLDLICRLKLYLPDHCNWKEAPAVLLLAVAHHPSVVVTQHIGLSLLAWLAENDACRRRIVRGGGTELIPTLMSLHPADKLINCNAAAALCWLIHAGELRNRPELPAHHVPTILATLSNHLDNASVFGNCVCVLCGLQTIPDEAKVLHVVRQGMEKHIYSAKVIESCLRWIRFRNTDDCLEALRNSIDVILRGMLVHGPEAHLQAQACEVLAFMARYPALQTELLQRAAVDTVLEISNQHPTDPRIQHGTMLFLTLLLPNEGETTPFGGNFTTIQTICCSLWRQHDDLT